MIPVEQPHLHEEIPAVLLVPELHQEQWSRTRAERLITAAGSLAITEALPTEPIGCLSEAARRAAEGDEQAKRNLTTNVWTDVMERVYKAGIVVNGRLDVLETGGLGRDGQSLDRVQENTLRYAAGTPTMRARAEAETRNAVRMQDVYRAGLLNDYWFVVISRSPEESEMSQEEKAEVGFFVETESCAIQATSVVGGEVVYGAAFVAGVKSENEPRHDADTVVELAATLGIEYGGLRPTEIIDRPLLVPKSLIPNGVIDLVQRYDAASGGTFFGESKPSQDYLGYLDVCAAREAALEPTVEKIVGHMIAEASTFHEPLDAVRRLNKLSQDYMVIRAVEDTDINPRVFGAAAATHITEARSHIALGDTEQAAGSLQRAMSSAISTSCPTAEKAAANARSASSSEESDNNDGGEGGSKIMSCPYCGAVNVGDPCAKILSCWDCHALVVSGKVKYEGNGGTKARKAHEVTKPKQEPLRLAASPPIHHEQTVQERPVEPVAAVLQVVENRERELVPQAG
jgi:hypothetical protein